MTYIEQIKKLYVLDATKSYGFSEKEIFKAENKLGFSFPKELKNYYMELGKSKEVNTSYNRLLPFEELNFNETYLIFYEENQEVCYWAIHKEDLKKENPCVYVGNSIQERESLEWHFSHQNLGEFFLDMAFYNGTMGGLRYNANILSKENIPLKAIDFIKKNYAEVLSFPDIRQCYYTDDFKEVVVICYSERGEPMAVFVGTQEERRFDTLLELFGYENWSYTSYDDDDEEGYEED